MIYKLQLAIVRCIAWKFYSAAVIMAYSVRPEMKDGTLEIHVVDGETYAEAWVEVIRAEEGK